VESNLDRADEVGVWEALRTFNLSEQVAAGVHDVSLRCRGQTVFAAEFAGGGAEPVVCGRSGSRTVEQVCAVVCRRLKTLWVHPSGLSGAYVAGPSVGAYVIVERTGQLRVDLWGRSGQ
jgi:hypothetical protein